MINLTILYLLSILPFLINQFSNNLKNSSNKMKNLDILCTIGSLCYSDKIMMLGIETREPQISHF